MTASILLLVLAAAAAVWGIVAGILVFEALRRRGEKVSFWLIRLMLPMWVHRYGAVTRDETGRTGPLFYHYVIAFNVALVAALLALLLKP